MNANANVVSIKLTTSCEKKTRTTVDTILVTPESLERWKAPPFQRPVQENEKVRALGEQLKHDGGVWPGIVTLGVLDGITYIIDGQHRKAAFMLSGLREGYTDVRIHHFEEMADMGEEFVRLNSQLVKMRPDDILRGMEGILPVLSQIRKACPFIAYDQIRRTPTSPVVSMAVAIRAWNGAGKEIPAPGFGSALDRARVLKESDIPHFASAMNLCREGFGVESEYSRLWGSLNLTLVLWLYRRLVMMSADEMGSKRWVHLTSEQFRRCLMSLSSSTRYLDWLLGRNLTDRDRSPAYRQIKGIFAERLKQDYPAMKNTNMPQPDWYTSK